MSCRYCGNEATLFLKHGATEIGLSCFPCADGVMFKLGVENMKGGATLEATVDGYRRWRQFVGHPSTATEISAFAEDLRMVDEQKAKRPGP